VYVHPVLIGRGKRLFPESDVLTGLRLTESRAFGNGVVLLRYERDSTATAPEPPTRKGVVRAPGHR
jgi:dihydrofolate reductase